MPNSQQSNTSDIDDAILEVAILDVIPGKENEFQCSFLQAQKMISSMPG